jgi:hypothetical protein
MIQVDPSDLKDAIPMKPDGSIGKKGEFNPGDIVKIYLFIDSDTNTSTKE